MKENNINGDTIYVVSRHSNWSKKGVEDAFVKAGIYPQKEAWKKFIEIAVITLGIAFTVAGIIFFFAYNWQYLHRFVKLGILQGLIIATVALALLPKLKPWIKNSLLTGASLLVGCLFAVFGQIYQTGANAYDFFLGWTVFILLWCIAAGFAPLWFVWLGLADATIINYSQQVAADWSNETVLAILFVMNAVAVIIAETVSDTGKLLNSWFIRLVTLVALTYCTIGTCEGIFNNGNGGLVANLLPALILYPLTVWRSLQTKSVFYLTTIPLSVIIIISACIMRMSDNEFIVGLFCTAIFIGAATTFLIRQIIKQNKTWHGQQFTDR